MLTAEENIASLQRQAQVFADRANAANTTLVKIREVLEGHRYQGAEAEVAAIRSLLWPVI